VARKRSREVVVDASLVLHLALPAYPYHEQAFRRFSQWADEGVTLIAPHLFAAEVDSGIRRLVHSGALTPEAGQQAQKIVDALAVRLVYNTRVRRRAREIAEHLHQSRVYDATYAALAELRRSEFWTADRRFYRAARNALSFVHFIGHD